MGADLPTLPPAPQLWEGDSGITVLGTPWVTHGLSANNRPKCDGEAHDVISFHLTATL